MKIRQQVQPELMLCIVRESKTYMCEVDLWRVADIWNYVAYYKAVEDDDEWARLGVHRPRLEHVADLADCFIGEEGK